MTGGKASPAVRAALKGFDPSDEQWDAIAHPLEPLAIVAGAGSGKTAVMAARIVWMVEERGARPAEVLGLTFTNKAARELEERIAAAFAELDPPPRDEPLVATYHSFADRLVREHGVRIGVDPEVGLLTEAQRWQLLLEEFDRLPPFDAVESRSTASICRTALGLADQCSNHLVTPEAIRAADERVLANEGQFYPDVAGTSRKRIELGRVVRAYVDSKERAGRIDFGDQVTKAVEVLERFPEVAEQLRARWKALLLDEYQDTNVAQRRLLQCLAPEGHNVTAVGDARQNIFQWRGSTLFNLIDFPSRHFLRAGGTPHDYLSLSENFRSGSRILAVANRIVEAVPAERRPGNPLRPHPANGEGSVGVRLLSDQHAEAAFVAEEVARLHGRPAAPGREPAAYRDFAVLVRRKAHIAPIYQALRARAIPVEVVGLGGLLQLPEVLDAVAWLRVLAEPGPQANRWLARLLLGSRFRIHYRDLALLARWAARRTRELAEAKRAGQEPPPEGLVRIPDETEFEPGEVAYSLTEALDHLEEIEALPPEARRRLERMREELASLRARAGGSLLDLVQTVVGEAGIAEAMESAGGGEAARANLTGFLGVVADFAPVSGEPSLHAFLAYLDAAEEVDETLEMATPAQGDSVKLMTVHQAKGLEFEVVFVPGVAARENEKGERVDSIFPDERTANPMTSYGQLPYQVREDAAHLPSPWEEDGRPKRKAEFARELKARAVEDERRLFYVALTRAKQRLYVTAAWWYERQARPRGPSIFFDEVAEAPETEVLPAAEMPPESPLLALLAELAVWPPDPPHRLRPDPLFPRSYPAVLEALLAGETSPEEVLGRLDSPARARAGDLLAEHRRVIAALERAAAAAAPPLPALPGSLSATAAVDLAAGRRRVEDLLRPLPERPSAARRIGTEIHRWIEEKARGLTGLADEEALDHPSAPVEPGRIAGHKATFERMGYGERRLARLDTGESMAELPFVLKVGGRLVRGRIDAVYETGEGGVEVVDFKTGREVEQPEADQLAVYAAALVELGVPIRGPLVLTYCYLATGTKVSREVTAEEARRALDTVAAGLDRLR